jgi:hypothetical protein
MARPRSRQGCAVDEGLVIGTQDIASKDQMVLRALVRLLAGGVNIQARFSERISECNVVFVPREWPHRPARACVVVRVFDPAHPARGPLHDGDLSVTAPLRMTNVMAILQSAMPRVHPAAAFDPEKGLLALFHLLAERTPVAERRRAVVPLSPGQQLVFDFAKQLVHTAVPMEELLSGAYVPGTPHRVSPVEEELIPLVPSHNLRHLVWNLAGRLAQSGAVTPPRPARYRLSRWPDTVGLSVPGHPRLAALLTDRAMTLPQLVTASGVPDPTVRWFLEASLALGLAIEHANEPPHPAAPPPPPTAVAPPGWLAQLRERLKLW